jgi:hypothetical protein
MFRIIRVPRSLDKFFRPLHHHFHWDHFEYFRLLVLVMAFTWGRHNVANLCRYLDIQRHRTRFNNFFLGEHSLFFRTPNPAAYVKSERAGPFEHSGHGRAGRCPMQRSFRSKSSEIRNGA